MTSKRSETLTGRGSTTSVEGAELTDIDYRSSGKKKKKMSPKVCERCNVSKISGSQQIGSVECEECEIWICRKCEELSEDDLKLISNTKEIARLTYKCKLCVEKQQQQTVQLTELTKKIDELEANQADSVVKMQENKEKIKKQDKDMKATQTEMKKYMDQLENI